ncbi:hypothetical protein [Actinomadura oligospora]|uniref:hypothetical protein n=1 Tax=Actinomadura oligospora TaxID=111804 RepID=UPI00068825AB|nr:hypothetical protein [Actinomadura oligospora]
MAFNHQRNYWLTNGGSMWVAVKFGTAGGDAGAQWIQASALPYNAFPTSGGVAQLETGRSQKRLTHANSGAEWIYLAFVEITFSPG